MKYRVERERTDAGFGPGWVVMTDTGIVVQREATWPEALGWAIWLRRARRREPWYYA